MAEPNQRHNYVWFTSAQAATTALGPYINCNQRVNSHNQVNIANNVHRIETKIADICCYKNIY